MGIGSRILRLVFRSAGGAGDIGQTTAAPTPPAPPEPPRERRFDLDGRTYAEIVEHARSDEPYEVCGLLAGEDGRVRRHYRVTNAARSMTFYSMDATEMLHAFNDMDEHDWELLAIYHSHTHTEAYPSETDVQLAFYPEACYLIVSLQDPEPAMRAFDIVDGDISERTLYVDGRPASGGSR